PPGDTASAAHPSGCAAHSHNQLDIALGPPPPAVFEPVDETATAPAGAGATGGGAVDDAQICGLPAAVCLHTEDDGAEHHHEPAHTEQGLVAHYSIDK